MEPRMIQGSPGSRIHLEFEGDDGWMLLEDHDNGTSEWQTHRWSKIPEKVAKQLNNCSSKGRHATCVAWQNLQGFDWYIAGVKRDGSGGHQWWSGSSGLGSYFKDNTIMPRIVAFSPRGGEVCIKGSNGYQHCGDLPEGLTKRLKRMNTENKHIKNICLSRRDQGRLYGSTGYWISDDAGTQWNNLGEHLSKELEDDSRTALHVCEADDGTWVVIYHNSYSCSTGVPEDLTRHLNTFYATHRRYQANQKRTRKAYRRRVQEEKEAAKVAAAKAAAEKEAAERKRKREEVEACGRKRARQARSDALLRSARAEARKAGFVEDRINTESRVVSFVREAVVHGKDGLRGERVRVNVYYSTGTVGTCLKHPGRPRPTQLFRRNCDAEELAAIFDNPRVHTGRGYFTRQHASGAAQNSTAAPCRDPLGTLAEEQLALQQYHKLEMSTAADVSAVQRAEVLLQIEAASSTRGELYSGLGGDIHVKSTIMLDGTGLIGITGAERGSIETVKPSTPAEFAGLKVGDRLVLVTTPVRSDDHLVAMVKDSKRAGMAVELQCLRFGSIVRMVVVTGMDCLIGVVTVAGPGGALRIETVIPGSPAERAGVRVNDFLTHITVPVVDTSSLAAALRMPTPTKPGTLIDLVVLRKREQVTDRSSWQCSICLSSSRADRGQLSCGHVFHEKCIADWWRNEATGGAAAGAGGRTSGSCPLCRKPTPFTQLKKLP